MRSNQTKRLKELERSVLGFVPYVLVMPGQTEEEAKVAAGYAPDARNPIIQIRIRRSKKDFENEGESK